MNLDDNITLSPDQQEAADACLQSLEAGRETVLVGAAGCITGAAEIICNRAGKGFRLPLRDLVHRFNGGEAGGKHWDPNIPTYVQVRAPNGDGRKGLLYKAVKSGIKETLRLRTTTGRTVEATPDHRFWVGDSWSRLGALKPGDVVYTMQPPKKKKGTPTKSTYKVMQLARHPFAKATSWQGKRYDGSGHSRKRTQKRVAYHRVVAEARASGLSTEEFIHRVRVGEHNGLIFFDPSEVHVHHINGNSRDNRPENLEVLSVAAHHQEHVNPSAVLWGEVPEVVESIESAGEQETFDLYMAGEPHNFTANGFVVHNSGKTTLTRYIIKQFGRRTVIGCPTGKAAQRAQQVTGVNASTIHKLLYQKVDTTSSGDLLFSEPRKPCSKRDLLIVDEASMLGSKLYRELMEWLPEGAPILFVGDREQLPPVRDTWGPDLLNPTGCLTQVHRQAAGNPIISLATAIREGRGREWLRDWNSSDDAVQIKDGSLAAIEWHLRRKLDGKDSTLITFTHDVRRWANQACREVMDYDKQGPITTGDRILIKANSRKVGVMNGDIFDVTRVESMRNPAWLRVHVKQKIKPVLVNVNFIESEGRTYWGWYNQLPNKIRFGMPFVHVWRGECITTHSAQGSSWSEVGFLWGHHVRQRMNSQKKADREFARRFLYTAVTRAEDKLAIFAI